MPTITASRRDFASGAALLGLASASALAVGRPALAQPASVNAAAADAAVKSAYEQFKGLAEGKNADYIPALAKVPSNYFGIALVTPQGKLSTAGDIDPTFSIQSISKVFTMALVFQESSEQFVEDDIGVDATGQVFNSIVAIEQYKGKEINPFVNPGAIATTGLVKRRQRRRGLVEDHRHPQRLRRTPARHRPGSLQVGVRHQPAQPGDHHADVAPTSASRAIRARPSTSTPASARSRSTPRIWASWPRRWPTAARTRSPASR